MIKVTLFETSKSYCGDGCCEYENVDREHQVGVSRETLHAMIAEKQGEAFNQETLDNAQLPDYNRFLFYSEEEKRWISSEGFLDLWNYYCKYINPKARG